MQAKQSKTAKDKIPFLVTTLVDVTFHATQLKLMNYTASVLLAKQTASFLNGLCLRQGLAILQG